jgi:hypothetical protein
MKKFYIEVAEEKLANIQVENKYYEIADTYKSVYATVTNQLIEEGSTDVSYYEDMYLEQNYNEQYKEAEENDTMSEFFDEMFNEILQEEDYKNLLEMLNYTPEEFDPEEELAKCISNKNRKSEFYGDGLKIISEYLESISREEALAVVTYYYLEHGFRYEDQLISDIKDDKADGSTFEVVGRAYDV